MTTTNNLVPLFPQSLKALKAWCIWRKEERDGEPTKVPYQPFDVGNGDYNVAHASHSDPFTWVDFSLACAALDGGCRDAGFGLGVFNDGSHAFNDLDDCIIDGVVQPWAMRVVERMNTYAEVTPSGNGLHIIGKGSIPTEWREDKGGRKIDGCELYVEKRFFTVTGNRLAGAPTVINDVSTDVLKALWEDIGNKKLRSAGLLIQRLSAKQLERLAWLEVPNSPDNDESVGDYEWLNLRCEQNPSLTDEQLDGMMQDADCKRWRDKWKRKGYRKATIKAVRKNQATKAALPSMTPLGATVQPAPAAPRTLVFTTPEAPYTNDQFVLNPLRTDGDEGWYPLGDVSINGGPSGAGKTRLTWKILAAQKRKETIFGHTTNGYSFLVLMADRGRRDNERTLKSMGMDPARAPIAFLPLVSGFDAAQAIINEIERVKPIPQVVFVEGADFLCDATDKTESAQFLKLMAKVAGHFNLAMILSVGSPKRKIGEGYLAKRDALFGSMAWGRLTTTIALLEFADGDDMGSARVLFVLPRNEAPEKFNMRFSSVGQLEIISASEAKTDRNPLDWLRAQTGWFRSAKMEMELEMSQPAASRKLKYWRELDLVGTRDVKNGRQWLIEYQYRVSIQ